MGGYTVLCYTLWARKEENKHETNIASWNNQGITYKYPGKNSDLLPKVETLNLVFCVCLLICFGWLFVCLFFTFQILSLREETGKSWYPLQLFLSQKPGIVAAITAVVTLYSKQLDGLRSLLTPPTGDSSQTTCWCLQAA